MSDGKNNQEFQMGQSEEKHAEDGNGKVLDSLSWESHVLTCDFPTQSLCKPYAKQYALRKFFITRVSKACNSLFSLCTSPSMLEIGWELESHIEY